MLREIAESDQNVVMAGRGDIAYERRRMMQIRGALQQGLDGSAPPAFFVAAAEYLLFSMDRLHRQDQAIHELLVVRVPGSDEAVHANLADLDERRGQARELVAELRTATRRLAADGEPGLKKFRARLADFFVRLNALMAPRRNPMHRYTDALFDEADWVRIAAVTPESRSAEARLFTAACSAAPPGLDPAVLTVDTH